MTITTKNHLPKRYRVFNLILIILLFIKFFTRGKTKVKIKKLNTSLDESYCLECHYQEMDSRSKFDYALLRTMTKFLFSGIAFKGDRYEHIRVWNLHHDHDYYKTQGEGNFLGLVKLLSEENEKLKEHLRRSQMLTSAKESKGRGDHINFLSNNFRNKILTTVQKHMIHAIVAEIKRNGDIFGLEIDTTQDITSKNQLSIVVRYINDQSLIRERTVAFIESRDGSGSGTFSLVKDALNKIELSLSKVVGVSTDGASNMRGNVEGFQAYIIKSENPKCIYTWCFSHRFNLVVQAVCSIDQIRYTTALAGETAGFFKRSYKRMDKWTETVKEMPKLRSSLKLKLIGATRWSSKQDAIHNIVQTEDHLVAVIVTCIKILNLPNLDGESLIAASNILNSFLKYENIITLLMLEKLFAVLQPTTKYLQSYGLSLWEAINSIKSV